MSQRYPTVAPGADPLLVVDATAGPEPVTLTAMTPGQRLRIQRRDSVAANAVTVTAPAPLTLDGTVGGSMTIGLDTEIRLDVIDGGFESFGGGGSAAAIAAAAVLADQTRQNNTYAGIRQDIPRSGVKVPAPRAVIVDTDWWTDSGDCAALRVVCQAERDGLVDIAAVVMNSRHYQGAGAIDAFMNYEGRRGVPIGIHPSYVASGSPPFLANMFNNNIHDVGYVATVPSAITVMRRALASSTQLLDIIAIGYLTNCSDLLASPADSISPLTGSQLVAEKVRRLWVMGGTYPSGSENNFNRDATAAAAASAVAANWPTPITFAGYEISPSNPYIGGNLLYKRPATDVCLVAQTDYGWAYGRPGWDAMLARIGCLGDPTTAGYTTATGTNAINATTGANTFTAGSGSHQYVVKARTDQSYVEEINPLLLLTNTASRTFGYAQPAMPSRETVTNTDRLILHLHAADLTDLADSAAISHWAARTGPAAIQLTSGARPTKQTVGGKVCALFGSGLYLSTIDPLQFGDQASVYVRVRWSTLPTSTQRIVGAESSVTSTVRALAMNGNTGSIIEGVCFTGGTGKTATSGASLSLNTWQTAHMRYDDTNMEAGIAGTFGTTFSTTNPNKVLAPVGIGSRYGDSSANNMVGYIQQVRIYAVRHDDAAAAAIVTEMAAS